MKNEAGIVSWDGSPLVALEWPAGVEADGKQDDAPEAVAHALLVGWELAQRGRTSLSVLVVRGPTDSPADEDVDQASEAVWRQVDAWLDRLISDVSARVIVRTGSPVIELLDELRMTEEETCVIIPETARRLLEAAPQLVAGTGHAIWLRPRRRDMPIFLLPSEAGATLAPALSSAVPLVRELSGRLLLGGATPLQSSEAEIQAQATEIARTLSQFDYRTIAGGVKIEIVPGDEATMVRELCRQEAVDVIAWPGQRAANLPWPDLDRQSVWIGRRPCENLE